MKLFMKRFKAASTDAALPKTRKELFNLIIKEDFSLIVDISIIDLLFSIPLYTIIFISITILMNLGSSDISEIIPLIFVTSIVQLPCFMIRNLGRSTLFGVMKKRVHNEAGFLSEVFNLVFKQNIKCGLLTGFIQGLGFFIGIIGSLFFLLKTTDVFARGIGIGICIIICMFLVVTSEYVMSLNNFYELKMKDSYKNASIFFIADLFINILYFVLRIVLPIIITIYINYSYLICVLLFGICLDGISILFMTLRSHTIFDMYINLDNYPEYVNKGLRIEKKED